MEVLRLCGTVSRATELFFCEEPASYTILFFCDEVIQYSEFVCFLKHEK
jgi:hypothetical protein